MLGSKLRQIFYRVSAGDAAWRAAALPLACPWVQLP
jgi:hypothetical protein